MAPSLWWWSDEKPRATPVVVKMSNPNYSVEELSSPEEDDELAVISSPAAQKRARGKNAKQLTWVLLLRAHRAAGCLSSLAAAASVLASAVRRRVAAGKTDAADEELEDNEPTVPPSSRGLRARFYSCIRFFLFLSLAMLGFEVAAYFQGWHLGVNVLAFGPLRVRNIFDLFYSSWVMIRVEYLAPLLQFLANVCVVLFLIQSADRLVLCMGCFWIKLRKIKPQLRNVEPDLEKGDSKSYFPMVLVQIPMCNEKEVLFGILATR